jgi:hypothetical protein
MTEDDMEETMTKAKLLATLKQKRAEFDAAVARVPHDQLTAPNVQGEWSVKHIIAHLTNYEAWMADRLYEQLRGINYVPTPLDMMHFDERNKIVHAQHKDRTLDDILAWSQATHKRLIEGIEAHTEAFLTEPQQFEGAPEPVIIWKMMQGDIYDHYADHIPFIEEFTHVH